ncbi:helix-turn-helix domain-containing protein [Alkalihalophilus marmarensis]|uniref:helix-turn-helix domain-containing protein n=1 Tax=Alkalihalophilus marmarensis TaxID=521377 RepID=UPI0020414A05|nr:helix-turn-helix transcriptional regulator [Alkalihalophilus marmarensis]MCM3487854.1 helix-turn-helix domain-containing protein [Alkalihalophilus marmarensis]
MEILNRIKLLCKDHGISVKQLEEKLDFPNNTIYQWKQRTPNLDKLQKVADYFNTSTDYLLGRTDKKRYYDLNDRDERNIQKQLEEMIEGLNSNSSFAAFDGLSFEDLDEEDRELLLLALENSLRVAKRVSKQKFTPKKYRN